MAKGSNVIQVIIVLLAPGFCFRIKDFYGTVIKMNKIKYSQIDADADMWRC